MAEKYVKLEDEKPKAEEMPSQATTEYRKLKYDKYRIPADLQLAEDHFKATRIAKPIRTKGKQNIDDFSGFPVDNKLVPMCCDLEELNFLSPGYPMYFQFLKFGIYFLMVLLVFSGIFNYITSSKGDNCISREMVPEDVTYNEIVKICVKDGINEYSLANKINDIADLEKQEIYNLFTIVLLFFLLQFLRKIQKETAVICDERDITASDFTARVRHFPTDWAENIDIDEEVKKFFETHALPGKTLKVVNVSCVYDVHEKLAQRKIIQEKTILKQKLYAKRAEGKLVSDDEFKRLDDEIANAQAEIIRISRQFKEGVGVNQKFMGEAYVTFESQRDLQMLLRHWNLSFLRQIQEYMNPNSQYKYKGQLLSVTQAPEPSDIKWENASVSDGSRFLRSCVITALIGVILIFFAFIIFLINDQKVSLLKGIKNDESQGMSYQTQITIELISQIASFCIIIVNYVLKSILKLFADFEAYGTSTNYLKNLAARTAIAQFLNTSCVTLALSFIAGNIWGPGGLISIVYNVHKYNAITPCIAEAIDFGWIEKFYKRWKIRNLSEEEKKHILMTQEELNSIFEQPQFEFSPKYAGYIKTIWSTALFAPLVPEIIGWSILSLFINYWIDKNAMLRRRARGVSYGPELPIYLIEFLEVGIVLFAAGNLFFNTFIIGFEIEQIILSILALTLAVLNALLPMDQINEWLFPIKAEDITEDTYTQMKNTFLEDYDRANPATEEIALESFIKAKEGEA